MKKLPRIITLEEVNGWGDGDLRRLPSAEFVRLKLWLKEQLTGYSRLVQESVFDETEPMVLKLKGRLQALQAFRQRLAGLR